MFMIRAVLKVVAVLGIALIIVLLVAAPVYFLLGAHLSQDKGTVTVPTARGIPADALEPDTLATSEQASQPQSRAAEGEPSVPVSESLIALPDPPTSEPDLSVSTPDPSPDPSKESPLTSTRESSADADASPTLAAESAPTPRQSSSTPPGMPSDDATPEPGLPVQSVSEPADTRFYTVKTGDTLYSIARQVYGEGKYWQVIYDANRGLIKDPVKLKLAWKLEVPPLDRVLSEN